MEQVLSIEDIARKTGLEESLLRYYESEYPSELPKKVWHKSALAFGAGAVEAFIRIHRHHSPVHDKVPFVDTRRFARVIAVTSGKGGVGKSNLALNLAIELQRLGKMTVVLDADMGMANIHLLAGISPAKSIVEVLSGEERLTDIILEGPGGIGVIPGGAGILALAYSTRSERLKIIRAMEQVESAAEIVVVDTAAGMSRGVREFLLAADEILFVLTPDITSLADAYGLLKALHHEDLFLERPIYSVINMVDTMKQAAGVANRFSYCARRFLSREVQSAGYLLKDSTVGAATARRTPYSIYKPDARVSRNTRRVAMILQQDEMPELRLTSAFGRYKKMLQTSEGPGLPQ